MNLHKLNEHRLEFPGLNHKVYFNYGGQGPLPRAALEAIIHTHEFLQNQGPFSGKVNSWLQQKTEQLRHQIADELAVNPNTLTLTENVTVGCNIPLWGLNWQAGDEILLTDCEHPGVIASVKEIARRFNLNYRFCPIYSTLNQGDPLAVISQHLTPQTRLFILSHVLWNTGQVLPLTEIVTLCHQQGVQVLVDAAQSVGMLPLNLGEIGVDFYAFTGHKWWCGPAGVGGLYVHPNALETLSPTFIGWRGIDVDGTGEVQDWKPDGRRFEVATSAFPQYEGLRAAIEVHQAWGTKEERYNDICQLSAYLWDKLSQIDQVHCLKDTPPLSGLVSFTLKNGYAHGEMVKQLEKQGFQIRKILSPNCLRACVHYFTLPEEIDQLVTAISLAVSS
ncbi:MAG: aminotransferase class V-fold PLP-dependent enzyme [Microcystaceae cyanobacterium]